MAQESRGRASLTQRAVAWVVRKAATYTGTALSLTDPKGWSPLLGNSTHTGKSVNVDSAMQVSTVWACNKILAESIGMLPIAVFERTKSGGLEKVAHPLGEILAESPNADMTPVEFREAGQVNLGLQGNAYSLVDRRGNGEVISLYPIPARNCVPERARDTGEIQYKVLEQGRWHIYPREKIWHIRGFGADGLVGYSPIGMMRQALGLSLAAEEFGAKVFSNGAQASGVVKIPNWLNQDQRKIAQENLQQIYSGLENAHKLMLLEGGMEFDKNAGIMPPEDLQLLQLRGFQVLEICRLYRVPPHMVAELERATFSNIEHMSLEFVTFTLLPWLRRWEAAANRWLLKPGERGRFVVRFDFNELLRADTQAQAEYVRTLVSNGMLSRNEGREMVGKNRATAPGMDDYTVQSNMVDVSDLGALAEAVRSKQAAPPPGASKGAEVNVSVTAPSAAAPATPNSVTVGDTRIEMALPESFAHEVKLHFGEDLQTVVASQRKLTGVVQETNAAVVKALERVAEVVGAEREPVYDDNGEIIASRIRERRLN